MLQSRSKNETSHAVASEVPTGRFGQTENRPRIPNTMISQHSHLEFNGNVSADPKEQFVLPYDQDVELSQTSRSESNAISTTPLIGVGQHSGTAYESDSLVSDAQPDLSPPSPKARLTSPPTPKPLVRASFNGWGPLRTGKNSETYSSTVDTSIIDSKSPSSSEIRQHTKRNTSRPRQSGQEVDIYSGPEDEDELVDNELTPEAVEKILDDSISYLDDSSSSTMSNPGLMHTEASSQSSSQDAMPDIAPDLSSNSSSHKKKISSPELSLGSSSHRQYSTTSTTAHAREPTKLPHPGKKALLAQLMSCSHHINGALESAWFCPMTGCSRHFDNWQRRPGLYRWTTKQSVKSHLENVHYEKSTTLTTNTPIPNTPLKDVHILSGLAPSDATIGEPAAAPNQTGSPSDHIPIQSAAADSAYDSLNSETGHAASLEQIQDTGELEENDNSLRENISPDISAPIENHAPGRTDETCNGDFWAALAKVVNDFKVNEVRHFATPTSSFIFPLTQHHRQQKKKSRTIERSENTKKTDPLSSSKIAKTKSSTRPRLAD